MTRPKVLALISSALPGKPAAPPESHPVPADGPTHVIAWFPPYLAWSSRWRRSPHVTGWWDLQEKAAYDAAEPPPGLDWSWDGPRDEDPLRLANWAALVLGHPVTVERFTVEVRPGRLPFRRWRTEPAYYVRPSS